MRPRKTEKSGSGDLFRARLDRIIIRPVVLSCPSWFMPGTRRLVSGCRRRRAIVLLARYHGPGHPGHLVGDGDRHQPGRLAFQEPVCPDADGGRPAPRVADDGDGADDEQVPQITIPHLRDAGHPLLAAGRVLLGHQSEPGGELPSGAERAGVAHGGNQRGRRDEADAGNQKVADYARKSAA